MDPSDVKLELLRRVREFPRDWDDRDFKELESSALRIFSSVFELERGPAAEPFVVRASSSQMDTLIEMGGVGIGLEVSRVEVDTELLNKVVGYVSTYANFNQALIFSPAGFTSEALALVEHAEPVRVEPIDLERLKFWITSIRIEEGEPAELTALQAAVREFSLDLAKLVADDPNVLDELEWRDVERMLAAAFGKLGFRVELTPPAKDGGRDIVLRCHVFGASRVYFVEVKHWRTKVGAGVVRDFLKVVLDEHVDRGLILATTGYTTNAFEELTEFERRRVQGADSTRMIAICQTYVRQRAGLYLPKSSLPTLLFDNRLLSA